MKGQRIFPNVHPMGCGTSTDSVNTGNVSPQPSDYYIDRATAISRNNLVSIILLLLFSQGHYPLPITIFGAFENRQKGIISLIYLLESNQRIDNESTSIGNILAAGRRNL